MTYNPQCRSQDAETAVSPLGDFRIACVVGVAIPPLRDAMSCPEPSGGNDERRREGESRSRALAQQGSPNRGNGLV